MRRLGLMLPIVALAACGGGTETKNKATAATSLEPGLYQVTAEVTAFRAADSGAPRIDTPVGTRSERSVCVGAGAIPADLFADEGFTCQADPNAYTSGGSINMTTRCAGRGLTGDITYSINGSFTADSFEAERNLTTRLSGDGDVVINSRVQGRRTGACTPGADAGNSAAPGNASSPAR
jgi:hypothetical protein